MPKAFFLALLLGLGGLGFRPAAAPGTFYLTSYPGISPEELARTKAALESFYGFPVVLLPPRRLPAAAFCPVRQRYRAAALLETLAGALPDTARPAKLLALIKEDVEVEWPPAKPHWGVFGLANDIGGDYAVVSTFRLKGHPDWLEKVALHEAGHLLHMPHCLSSTPACLMNDAQGKGVTVEQEELFLCDACRERLWF